jgi:hypothetical protein
MTLILFILVASAPSNQAAESSDDFAEGAYSAHWRNRPLFGLDDTQGHLDVAEPEGGIGRESEHFKVCFNRKEIGDFDVHIDTCGDVSGGVFRSPLQTTAFPGGKLTGTVDYTPALQQHTSICLGERGQP